jgi:hypothetical protein
VEGLCEAAADTGAAAGDEDRVTADFHSGSFSLLDSRMVCIHWEVGTIYIHTYPKESVVYEEIGK